MVVSIHIICTDDVASNAQRFPLPRIGIGIPFLHNGINKKYDKRYREGE